MIPTIINKIRIQVAAGLGFEPRWVDSESTILPLDDPAMLRQFYQIYISSTNETTKATYDKILWVLKRKFILLFFIGVLFAAIGLVVSDYSAFNKPLLTKDDGQTFKVIKVIDGDTIQVLIYDKKETVRLIGIDTPETVDPRREVECFGKEASRKLKSLVNGKSVVLKNDPTQSERDKYGRLLRYVFLKDGVHVNKLMIQEGYAHEYTYDSPYKYQNEFKLAEKKAIEEKRGIWTDLKPSSCPKDK